MIRKTSILSISLRSRQCPPAPHSDPIHASASRSPRHSNPYLEKQSTRTNQNVCCCYQSFVASRFDHARKTKGETYLMPFMSLNCSKKLLIRLKMQHERFCELLAHRRTLGLQLLRPDLAKTGDLHVVDGRNPAVIGHFTASSSSDMLNTCTSRDSTKI